MCESHKHTGSKVGQSLGGTCKITRGVEQINNTVVAQIPEGANSEQVKTFIDKVKDLAKSIFD